MTLVGYFNSMRELGGMRRLIEDDIRSRLRNIEERGLSKRLLTQVEELTSRRGSTDIPRILDRLDGTFDPGVARDRRERRKRGERPASSDPIDVLLATNMLSVGVDVDRLGLMVVGGQPKMTSEYIQATSRVGRSRQAPGLICVAYNWARPRDLSHYEHFAHYHSTFYQQVEAFSVTPFAPRALDRGLSALLVSLVRDASEELNPNPAAENMTPDAPEVRAAVAAIDARARAVAGEATGDLVAQELHRRIAEWHAEAQRKTGGRSLQYAKPDATSVGLLHRPGPGPWSTFTCLNSLRDVEPEIGLILDDGGLDVEE
jgi:ATP-dependent helicase YprA (DUF1998 family)